MFRTSTGPTTHSLYRSALNTFELLYTAECEISMSSCFQSPVCEDEWKSMESSVPAALFEHRQIIKIFVFVSYAVNPFKITCI